MVSQNPNQPRFDSEPYLPPPTANAGEPEMSDPTAPRPTLPIYAQIAATLRQSILDKQYAIDQRLPTETQLADHFQVNRHTIRQAIAVLKTEGLVRVERGRGTFVNSRSIRYTIGQRVRYNEALRAQGHDAVLTVLSAQSIPASLEVAQGLGIEPGDAVATVERLALADQEPISLTTSCFPLNQFPDFLAESHLEQLRTLGSISKFLHHIYNCDHIRKQTRISAQMVNPEDAQLLKLPANQPILRAESINVNQHQVVIEYGVTRFRGDRMELVFENQV
jgi:GntR family phosphonate transport system transcriptional regulator